MAFERLGSASWLSGSESGKPEELMRAILFALRGHPGAETEELLLRFTQHQSLQVQSLHSKVWAGRNLWIEKGSFMLSGPPTIQPPALDGQHWQHRRDSAMRGARPLPANRRLGAIRRRCMR